MDNENSYVFVRDQPTRKGTNWPRVSSRTSLNSPANWWRADAGAARRDANRYKQPGTRDFATAPHQPMLRRDDNNEGPKAIDASNGMAELEEVWAENPLTQPRRSVQSQRSSQHRSSQQAASERRTKDLRQKMQNSFQDLVSGGGAASDGGSPRNRSGWAKGKSNNANAPLALNATHSSPFPDTQQYGQAHTFLPMVLSEAPQFTPPAVLEAAAAPLPGEDPTVIPTALPHFNAPPAPPDSQAAMLEDAARGKPERGQVALRALDQRGMANMAYPAVYRDAPFLQLPQQNLIINPVPVYLTIDSRDRDRVTWPQANHFQIPLASSRTDTRVKAVGERYKNIYSISLLSAVVPNMNNVLDEPYLLFQIDEIDKVYDSANPACARAFTKLYFKEVCPSSKYLRLDKGVGDPLTKIYWPAPKASLDRLTFSFRRFDGSLFAFGPDSAPPADPLTDRQTSVTLEIRTYVVDAGRALGHRNIDV